MQVLILSAGAKVPLVRAFAALARVVAADIRADSAALYAAHRAVLLPRGDDPAFAGALKRLCSDEAIDLIVPTRDGELLPLAALAPQLAAKVLTSSATTLATVQDKQRFNAFCLAEGFAIAPLHDPDHPVFPVFARPAVGAGGRGARRIDSLEALAALGPGYAVQQWLDDPEYSIDLLSDFNGRPLQAVARSRLLIRDGEAWQSRVEDIPALTEAAMRLGAALGLVGHSVIQAFYGPEHGVRFIEVNPRFGGASILSIEAGLASPQRLLALAAGDQSAAQPRPIRHGLTLLRHGADILVDRSTIERVKRWE